jgi:hypothetical protein
MEADFPVAHSMDTEWFAVDCDGQVALFITGDMGSMPVNATEADLDEVLGALGSERTYEEMDYDVLGKELARLGLHVYEDDSVDWFSGPYRRTHRPKRPLHVDQLPPQLRKQVKVVRFDDLLFMDKKVFQPCDHVEGSTWESGYLAEDRKTVRPMPGYEEEYRKDVERMRQEKPEEFRKYRFEGLDDDS